MTKEQRENKKLDYINNIIKNAWTFEKLTNKERTTILEILYNTKIYTNNKENICELVSTIYRAYLLGLDYTPLNWREKSEICF